MTIDILYTCPCNCCMHIYRKDGVLFVSSNTISPQEIRFVDQLGLINGEHSVAHDGLIALYKALPAEKFNTPVVFPARRKSRQPDRIEQLKAVIEQLLEATSDDDTQEVGGEPLAAAIEAAHNLLEELERSA